MLASCVVAGVERSEAQECPAARAIAGFGWLNMGYTVQFGEQWQCSIEFVSWSRLQR